MGKAQQVKSIAKTKADKKFREVMQKVNEKQDKYVETLSKYTDLSPEQLQMEFQSVFIDTFRRSDDLATMAKVNIANLEANDYIKLMTKKQFFERKYQKALDNGDEDLADKLYEEMMTFLTDTDSDYKKFAAINAAIKTIKGLEPKVVTHLTQESDDNVFFQDVSGVFDYDEN